MASTLLGQSVTAHFHPPCLNPSVRREWRSMPREERAEWLAAVKVIPLLDMFLGELTLPCVVPEPLASQLFSGANLQHHVHSDPAHRPQQFIFRRSVNFTNCRLPSKPLIHTLTDWSYVHMDLNPMVGLFYFHPRTTIEHKHRSTSLASSFPGIVHSSRTSTLPSAKNATIRATSRIGIGQRVWSR